MPKKERYISLSWKFAAIILIAGMLPLLFLTTAATTWLSRDYRNTILASYENTARYISKSIDAELGSLNDLSKVVYFYNPANAEQHQYSYMDYDNVHKILLMSDPERRQEEMEAFLHSIYYVDSSIVGTYFLGNAASWRFYAGDRAFLSDWNRVEEMVAEPHLDTESRELMLFPPHVNDYLYARHDIVFTIGRNYFDISSNTLLNQPYLGTLLIDVDMRVFSELLSRNDLGTDSEVYIYDSSGMCYYSNRKDMLGKNLFAEGISLTESDELTIHVPENSYGLLLTVKLDETAFYAPIRDTRNMVYGGILLGTCFLILVSLLFARHLTRPVKNMMQEMSKLERGDFRVDLPIDRNDELGVLSKRFVDMSRQLESHIEQSYIAKLKQSEAEMTALKSQIYPHFLYNTLEVIRMTALDDQDGRKVSKMIESLSEQIHYMIGTLQDFVYLEKEADVVERYVFLLNCRISGEVELVTELNGFRKARVPKLILQPIVENAYVHGLKPAGERGQIKIFGATEGDDLIISVMDDGVGMGEEKIKEIYALLDSDAVGIKREDNWQSIGMKNVHDRLRYLFGAGYGIKITSCQGVGTLIQIRMPYKEEEEPC